MSELKLAVGIDSGSTTTKIVILRNNEIAGSCTVPSGVDIKKTATANLTLLLDKLGFAKNDIGNIISTGYGRDLIEDVSATVTEITCHARGALYYFPNALLVMDIGGQDNKFIRINKKGQVTDFRMNDKCAAGTGRFLEVMARRLNLSIEKLGSMEISSASRVVISNTCTVFVESEVISLLSQGTGQSDIISGVLEAIVSRVVGMAKPWVKKEDEIIFTGGVAKNDNVLLRVQKKMGCEVKRPPEPQIIGALGAALIALKNL
jgi:predicted CoA-substrate-specific enzyme activase